jgi:hypothetical protein
MCKLLARTGPSEANVDGCIMRFPRSSPLWRGESSRQNMKLLKGHALEAGRYAPGRVPAAYSTQATPWL